MAREIKGRLRYDEKNDSFVYEILDHTGNWSLCKSSKCVRREGAEDGEEANYVHFSLLKTIVMDAEVFGASLSLA